MLTLALDTSTATGSIALFRDHILLYSHTWKRLRSHSETVTHEIEKVLKDQGLEVRDLNLLAVGIGPGSFTGIRVSVNVAKTLGYSLGIPILAYDSLQVLAEAGFTQDEYPVLAMVNAFKNRVYVSSYHFKGTNWEQVLQPQSLEIRELEAELNWPHLCLGDGYHAYLNSISPGLKAKLNRSEMIPDFPQATILGEMAVRDYGQKAPILWNELVPLYIRASEAEEKLIEKTKR